MIIVGDVHAVPGEIADCQKLITGLITLRPYADTVLFLGDQFHNHGIVHLSVVQFWRQSFRALQSVGFRVIALVGNHDIMTSGEMWPNAMQCVDGTGVEVVDTLQELRVNGEPTNVVLTPYVHDHNEFAKIVNVKIADLWASKPRTLICHQTFQGVQYDNGFYASDGVEQSDVEYASIISGHIHSAARFGKVYYVGSPRWRSRDDANKPKAVSLFNVRTHHLEVQFDTADWCSPILHFELTPESTLDATIAPTARVTVTLRGPAAWVRTEAEVYKAKGYAVRRLPDAAAAPRVKESADVSKSFATFLKSFKTPGGTPPEVLERMVSQLS